MKLLEVRRFSLIRYAIILSNVFNRESSLFIV